MSFAIGHARGNGTRGRRCPRQPHPFVIFSASKVMTTVVTHHLLEERGLLHVGDRVCEYIPEYAVHRAKQVITIEQLLHRALPNLPPPR